MSFWNQVNAAVTRQSAFLADPLIAEFKKSFDAQQIVASFFFNHAGVDSVPLGSARSWAQMNVVPKNRDGVERVLNRIYAVGSVIGSDSAHMALVQARVGKAEKPSDTPDGYGSVNTDWQNWTPGNRDASRLVKPKGALRKLMDKTKTVEWGLSNTKLNRIGTVLGDGLNNGWSPDVVASKISDVIADPKTAFDISNTEMRRAMSAQSLEDYASNGVTQVNWNGIDPCDACQECEDNSPVNLGEPFNEDGVFQPPMHPNCYCVLEPEILGFVLEDYNYAPTDSVDLALSPDVVKFDPDEARDYHGRWTSDGGGLPSGWSKLTPTAEDRKAFFEQKMASLNNKPDVSQAAKDAFVAKYGDNNTLYDRFFKDWSAYQSPSGVKLFVANDLGSPEAVASKYAGYVEGLQQAFPIQGASVVVQSSPLSLSESLQSFTQGRTTVGMTGSPVIAVNPQTIADTADKIPDNYFMSARSDAQVSNEEYTMAHEWGHAYSMDLNRQPEQRVYAVAGNNKVLSDPRWSTYGSGNANERYAELFAQNYLESKYPTIAHNTLLDVPQMKDALNGN